MHSGVSFKMRFYIQISILFFVTVAAAMPALAMTTADKRQKITASDRYIACTGYTRRLPEEALRMSDSWLQKDEKSLAARHCRALALFGLQKFDQAAEALEYIGDRLTQDSPKLWVSVLRQAGHARLKAKQFFLALNNLSKAIAFADNHRLDTLTVELLMDRAEVWHQQNQPYKAVQDLDYILTLEAEHEKALLARARIFRQIGFPQLAQEDLRRVLAIAPKHQAAHLAMRELEANQ